MAASPPTAHRVAMLVLWVVFAGRLLFVAAVIPPWQNPDEPSHFAVIRTLAKDSSIDLSRGTDVDVEAEILASMALHGWWKAYDQPVPDPLPSRFSDMEIAGHLNRAMFGEPALYYLVASRYCRVIGAASVLDQYFALRIALDEPRHVRTCDSCRTRVVR